MKKEAAVGVQSLHRYEKIQWHREFPQRISHNLLLETL